MFDEDADEFQESLGDSPLVALFGMTLEKFRTAAFRIRRGSLLLHFLSQRPSEARIEEGRFGFTVSHTLVDDPDLRSLLIWELADSITEGWNSTNEEDLPLTFGAHNVYLVSVWPIDRVMAEAIDGVLGSPGYIGAAQIDFGNPLQRNLFWDSLFDDLAYSGGRLLHSDHELPPEDRHDLHGYGEWWDTMEFDDVVWADDENPGPPNPPPESFRFSDRGRASAKRIQARAAPSHIERVITALVRQGRSAGEPATITALPYAGHAIVDRRKLTEYVLNPDHPTGANKARLFHQKLGIKTEDWKYLEVQILHGLVTAQVHRVRSEEWGVKYHADMAIVGKNGATQAVRTAWIVGQYEPPRLVSAYLAPPSVDPNELATPHRPPLLERPPIDDEDWATLHELASKWGKNAADSTVPTPMYVDGRGYPEGAVGSAIVTIKDARRGLARWLIRMNMAHHGHKGGAAIGPPPEVGPSAERASAWAQGYAGVLALNAVECSVRSYLD